MKRITAFKITDICMSGFRNHLEKQHFRFGDMSFISGHNGSGKTTMAHAVCYALFGVLSNNYIYDIIIQTHRVNAKKFCN